MKMRTTLVALAMSLACLVGCGVQSQTSMTASELALTQNPTPKLPDQIRGTRNVALALDLLGQPAWQIQASGWRNPQLLYHDQYFGDRYGYLILGEWLGVEILDGTINMVWISYSKIPTEPLPPALKGRKAWEVTQGLERAGCESIPNPVASNFFDYECGRTKVMVTYYNADGLNPPAAPWMKKGDVSQVRIYKP